MNEQPDEAAVADMVQGNGVITVQRGFIKPGVSAPWLGRPTQNVQSPVIKAVDTLDDAISDLELSRSTILCIPYYFKHGTGANISFFANPKRASNVFASSTMMTKRQRTDNFSKYDRYLELMDLSDPGKCFVIFFRNADESRRMLKYCQNLSLIGTVMMLGSPARSAGETKSSGLTVVEPEFPLVPLVNEADPNFDLSKLIPTVPMVVPDRPGRVTYFAMHNAAVGTGRFQFLIQTVSCTGRMCDRAHPLDAHVACGCTHRGFDSIGAVAEMTLSLVVPESVDYRGRVDIENYRSHRLTELIFADTKMLQRKDQESLNCNYTDFKNAAIALFDHVNNNGGWTVVGWIRKGEIGDMSTEGAQVDSNKVSLHIALVTPTAVGLRKLEDNAFNARRIVFHD